MVVSVDTGGLISSCGLRFWFTSSMFVVVFVVVLTAAGWYSCSFGSYLDFGLVC